MSTKINDSYTYFRRLNLFYRKNKGYLAVLKTSQILNGKEEDKDGLPEDSSLNDLKYFK